VPNSHPSVPAPSSITGAVAGSTSQPRYFSFLPSRTQRNLIQTPPGTLMPITKLSGLPASVVPVAAAAVLACSLRRTLSTVKAPPKKNEHQRVRESSRIASTDTPCIVMMQTLLKDAKDYSKLSQGVVFWKPPKEAIQMATDALNEGKEIHGYGMDEGNSILRQALKEKLKIENGLSNSEVMVTCGANQAFANLVVSLSDHDDAVIMFPPYYFNHLMAVQMTGGSLSVELGACDHNTMLPDVSWLEDRLGDMERKKKVSMVVLSSPCNPTGVVIPKDILQRISDACEKAGVWLVMDNTYEYFVYDGLSHTTLEGPHIINIFSFSKAYGMMGWRIGYIAYPPTLRDSLLKAQDTIPICPTQISERVAIGALKAGRKWVEEKLPVVCKNRDLIRRSLEPLKVVGGQGAIYLLAKLPEKYMNSDVEVVKWLANRHKVALIPGSSCGMPGWVRVAYANMLDEDIQIAAKRLKAGVEALTSENSPEFN